MQNRLCELIATYTKEWSEVWLVKIDPDGNEPVYWRYEGETIYNSHVDYVLPCYDAQLDWMLKERLRNYDNPVNDHAKLEMITERIRDLGGHTLDHLKPGPAISSS